MFFIISLSIASSSLQLLHFFPLEVLRYIETLLWKQSLQPYFFRIMVVMNAVVQAFPNCTPSGISYPAIQVRQVTAVHLLQGLFWILSGILSASWTQKKITIFSSDYDCFYPPFEAWRTSKIIFAPASSLQSLTSCCCSHGSCWLAWSRDMRPCSREWCHIIYLNTFLPVFNRTGGRVTHSIFLHCWILQPVTTTPVC